MLLLSQVFSLSEQVEDTAVIDEVAEYPESDSFEESDELELRELGRSTGDSDREYEDTDADVYVYPGRRC